MTKILAVVIALVATTSVAAAGNLVANALEHRGLVLENLDVCDNTKTGFKDETQQVPDRPFKRFTWFVSFCFYHSQRFGGKTLMFGRSSLGLRCQESAFELSRILAGQSVMFLSRVF
jgi:hypothetical protein